jgi:hypothetical protein
VDSSQHFGFCLPAGLQKSAADGYPAGSIRFQGFGVPAGTNLVSKQLIIIPGADPNLQGATASGTFKAGNVTFQRSTAEEGAAGHSIQYVIYSSAQGGKTLSFEFVLNSTNRSNYPPASRPAQFDYAAQVKSTEEIMKTFRRLP